jgi:hypothetical protein
MSINVSARDIDAMRNAQHITVTETDGNAVLTCKSTSPIRPFTDSIAIPICTDVDGLGASPSRGGDSFALSVRHARRNPNWAALVNTVRDGDQLEVQWERNGYALLLVRSRGEVEDRFYFPVTRRTRRALDDPQARPQRRSGRLPGGFGIPVPVGFRIVPIVGRKRAGRSEPSPAAIGAAADAAHAAPVVDSDGTR